MNRSKEAKGVGKMRGYGVSKGLCYARILVLNEEPIVFPTKTGCILEEEEKFKDAHRSVLAETRALRDRTREESGNNAAEIIDIQCSLLKDNGLIDPIRKEIAGGTGAAAAVENVMNGFIKQFEGMENQYFAQRAVDLKDLKNNLIYKILNIPRVDITMLAEPTIIAGNDITPSQTARMDQHMVSGLLMEFGGNTSHTAILARTLDIPAIVGIKGLLKEIKTGDMVGFDGETGEIFTNLTKVETASLQTKIQEEKQRKERLQVLAAGRAATLDGKLL
ncbi:MAG TPA: PEP-utilizing enzyme, partial [Lachnospiraceae bacterium]|nr:PEP-utilizing enzyme [Lachnospiraceae bacterium]